MNFAFRKFLQNYKIKNLISSKNIAPSNEKFVDGIETLFEISSD